jgi:hypothetical protein
MTRSHRPSTGAGGRQSRWRAGISRRRRSIDTAGTFIHDHVAVPGEVDAIAANERLNQYDINVTRAGWLLGGSDRPGSIPRNRVAVLHGGLGARARRRAEAILSSEGPRVVLATGRYIGEGFDDSRLDTLCSPCRSPERAR